MIKLIHGDSIEKMKDIPDGSINMVLADPPYKMTKRGRSCRPNWMPNSMGDNVFKGVIPSTELWMLGCYRVMSDKSHIYVFTNTISITENLNVAKKVGFKLHNIISMIKDTGMPNRWYYKQTELVLFFRKGKAKPINDYTSRDNVRVVMPKKSNGKLHITQKPLLFIEKLVTNSSCKKDTILDPFMGSGTTGVVCKKLDRDFIGIDNDKHCVNIANERIETS